MEDNKDKQQIFLFAAVLILFAGCIRFIGLTILPLSNNEAYSALQALQIFSVRAPNEITIPIYTVLTGVNFSIWGASDFLARLWPALIGSLVVLLPFGFRKFLGNRTAIIFAFCLAVDPVFIAASKQVNGTIMACFFIFFTIMALINKKHVLGGVLAVFTILSGASVWLGVLSLAVAYLLNKLLSSRPNDNDQKNNVQLIPIVEFGKKDWLNVGKGAVIGIVLIGTIIFTKPELLSGLVSGFVEFVKGWGRVSNVTILSLLFIIVAYEFIPFVLGGLAIARGIKENHPVELALARWMLVSTLLVVFYPAHQLFDLIWLAIPLLILASRQIERIAYLLKKLQGPDFAYGALVAVLLVFSLLSAGSFINQISGSVEYIRGLVGMVAGIVLIAVTALLVAWGWQAGTSKKGLLLGFLFVGILVGFSTSMRSAGLSRYPAAELWNSSSIPVDADIVTSTINDMSLWKTGLPESLSILRAGDLSASMAWYFRNYKNFSTTLEVPGGNLSDIVINDGAALSSQAAYRGQDFVWERTMQKKDVKVVDWIKWLLFRKANYNDRTIVLWFRTDLFPGYVPENNTFDQPLLPSK